MENNKNQENMNNNTGTKNILWAKIKKEQSVLENSMDLLFKKQTGSFYTSLELSTAMIKELFSILKKNKSKNVFSYTFLEPCVGIGSFVFSYLREISNLNPSKAQAQKVINNIFVADINPNSIDMYKKLLKEFVKIYWDIDIKDEYFVSNVGSGLLIDITKKNIKYIPLEKAFKTLPANHKFDIIATNPPYKNLKADAKQYNNDVELIKDKEIYKNISNLINNNFKYSIDGIANLYKLFTEEIITKYTNDDAYISILVPKSITSDKSCEKLRTYILKNTRLISIKNVKESSKFVKANQALSAILLTKNGTTDRITITDNYGEKTEKTIENISLQDIINEKTSNSIIFASHKEYTMIKKIQKFPSIKELDFIKNLRGEFDLTLHKKYITNSKKDYTLIRGRNIGYYKLNNSRGGEFVSNDFIPNCSKKKYIYQERLACQQIANIHKDRRLSFAIIPKNNVIGNSCNFITVENNIYGINIYMLLGILNTKLVNWLFKLTSSNNHINNYELDAIPIPINSIMLPRIEVLVRDYLINKNQMILDEIEHAVLSAYGIDHTEDSGNKNIQVSTMSQELFFKDISCIINIDKNTAYDIFLKSQHLENHIKNLPILEKKAAHSILNKYQKINKNEILNHITFKLSDLDLEMIKNIPQGGNWKNIPKNIIMKSQRLIQISKTGGRTTLYGRIDYLKPSYTITTCFNRPGNGTNVHPTKERVLSIREAARIQTFPDNYLFYGSKTDILKQVGNAVPVILAYSIGKKIKEVIDCRSSIDLFCGAGGLTYGFKLAGINSIIANDIELSACITLKTNMPEIKVLCGDITDIRTKEQIVNETSQKRVDIICGGPPCQGFSMAGFRAKDDPRNQLFKDFADIVSIIKPKLIIFENVEGILTHNKGHTYKDILTVFSELGYFAEGYKLIASDFGVPQKRKRVIIFCTRKDLSITPKDLVPKPFTLNEYQQINVFDTIYDLEKVECGENAKYHSQYESTMIKFLKNKISADDFVQEILQ